MSGTSSRYDLGFLGGGQLARMSIMAAQRMGLKCISLDPSAVTPASEIAPALEGNLDDPEAIAEVFRQSDHVTLENEFIPSEALRRGIQLSGRSEECLLPGIDSLAIIQDKLRQRQAYREFGAPSPKAVPLEGDGEEAVRAIGFPMVLKARFGGYDGKGTRFAKTPQDLDAHRELWSKGGWLAETWIPFGREVSAMVFVSADGAASGSFPTMETRQVDGVCDLVLPMDNFVASEKAQQVAIQAVRAVNGRGLFGVEMFETQEGDFLINEIAPRPHNTGHYTLDWGGVSQFEQHVRLAMDLPLGEAVGGPVCMANLLGQAEGGNLRNAIQQSLTGDPGVHVHWYGKSESRPGRKMGHINVAGGQNLVERATAARTRFYEGLQAT